MKTYPIFFVSLLSIFQPALGSERALTKVPLYFVEALAPKDTTSSDRFTKDYQGAIDLGKSLTKHKLAKCGYELETISYFYDANDPIQAKEQASKAASQGAWLIVGPRRSNHYLLLVKGAEETPTLSIMASASEVGSLGKLHQTMSPLNSEMAMTAARAISKKFPKSKYLSITSEECISCKDFAHSFKSAGEKFGLKNEKEVSITGELPALDPILASIASVKPKFILIPNYSKTASHLIAAIQKVDSKIFFIGGDGWGDSKYGFVQAGQDIGSAEGLTVRGFPPAEEGLKAFSLGKEALLKDDRPTSGPSMAILKTMDATASILCKSKPSNSQAFKSTYEQNAQKVYSSPWGVSIYTLRKGEIAFKETKQIVR